MVVRLDTAFYNNFNNLWQRVADEVALSQAAVIDHISHRLLRFGQSTRIRDDAHQIPPRAVKASERAQVLYEQIVDNPSRIGTDRSWPLASVLKSIASEMSYPRRSISTRTRYIGWRSRIRRDLDTHWRWEFSLTDQNGQAAINPATHDWRHSPSNFVVDTAYQLIGVPEPSTMFLLLCTFGLVMARRAPRRTPGVA
jgi:hypothetical protein